MLNDRAGGTSKSSNTRFNLLLLEDGEFFLDDFSVHRFLDSIPNPQRKQQGRLKVCTRGFFFEPQDQSQPILRFAFRDMAQSPVAEFFTNPITATYLSFSTSLVVEMKERGVDHPYISRPTNASTSTSSSPTLEPPGKYLFSLLHSKLEEFLHQLEPLYTLAHRPRVLNKVDEERLLAPILTPRCSQSFDTSLLVDFRERPLLSQAKRVDRIVPLLKYPGCLMLTNQRLYVQPALVNNIGDPVLNWCYEEIITLYKRRYLLKQTGLEVELRTGESFFLSFTTRQDRDEIYHMMMQQPELETRMMDHTVELENTLQQWQRHEISNFEYLTFLNKAAGRTINDLTQYPVFPWILKDYTSSTLDFNDPSIYRDLSKPMGALNPDRLESYQQRYMAMPRGMEAEGIPPPFLYGTHYSTPGYVLFYLVRMAPAYMLCLQNGKFDAPDRLFRNIESTFKSCLTNHADLKELIPAFYDEEAFKANLWLCNHYNLDLGTTQQHTRVGDVELPPWASNPHEFIQMNRQALESEYVSQHLHEWIDLIFGYKQQGEEAIKANNLFYYLSYEGSVDLEKVTDPVEKCSLEAQIQEFGQTPTLLFKSPHPGRSEWGKSVDVATTCDRWNYRTQRDTSSSASSSSDIEGRRSGSGGPSGHDASMESNQEGDDESGSSATKRPSMFVGFHPRSIGVPMQAQRFMGGLTAQIKKRMSIEPPRRWTWMFLPSSNLPTSNFGDWVGSAPYMLHSSEVTSISIGRDSRALFSTSKDTTFKVSATSDGTVRRNLSCPLTLSCCDVSLNEKYVFIASWNNCIYMYSVEFGRVIDQLTAHDDGLSSVRVIDDCRVVTASWDGSIKVWQYSTTGFNTVPLWSYMDCDESIVALDVNLDGTLCVAGTTKGFLYLLDLRNNEFIRRLPSSPEKHAEISGLSCCGSLSHIACITLENELSLFTVERLRIAAIPVKIEGQVRCLDSDTEYAVGGTSTGKLLFWKLDEPPERSMVLEIPDAHAHSISAVKVAHNGNMLVSAAVDGSIRIWKLRRKSSRNRLSSKFF